MDLTWSYYITESNAHYSEISASTLISLSWAALWGCVE